MTTVNVTEQKNTVVVDETTNTVTVNEGAATVVQVNTQGPQGPVAAVNFVFEGDNKVNGSIPVYNASSEKFEATATHTVLTLVDGGNF
tara:strand:+ start:380 stop:643 length:264 start_codon:yes stop_codon:yes gene_type:complete